MNLENKICIITGVVFGIGETLTPGLVPSCAKVGIANLNPAEAVAHLFAPFPPYAMTGQSMNAHHGWFMEKMGRAQE